MDNSPVFIRFLKIIFHYNLEDYFDSPTITREEAEELINNLNNNLNRTREKLEY